MVMEPDGLGILTLRQAVLRAPAIVLRHVRDDWSLSGELPSERREEADAP